MDTSPPPPPGGGEQGYEGFPRPNWGGDLPTKTAADVRPLALSGVSRDMRICRLLAHPFARGRVILRPPISRVAEKGHLFPVSVSGGGV